MAKHCALRVSSGAGSVRQVAALQKKTLVFYITATCAVCSIASFTVDAINALDDKWT